MAGLLKRSLAADRYFGAGRPFLRLPIVRLARWYAGAARLSQHHAVHDLPDGPVSRGYRTVDRILLCFSPPCAGFTIAHAPSAFSCGLPVVCPPSSHPLASSALLAVGIPKKTIWVFQYARSGSFKGPNRTWNSHCKYILSGRCHFVGQHPQASMGAEESRSVAHKRIAHNSTRSLL